MNKITKKWNIESTNNYLKLEGINESIIAAIMKYGTENELQSVLSLYWFGNNNILIHIETLIYIIFLGVSEIIDIFLKSVLTKNDQYIFFHKYDNQLKTI